MKKIPPALKSFAADVSKRCCICQATVEVVLPAVFDEIRYRLIHGESPFVGIESFGSFGVVEIPERERLYTYKGANELRKLPPKKRIKFAASNNFTKEVEAGEFDPARESFYLHPGDTKVRRLCTMEYNTRTSVAIEYVKKKK